MPALAFDAHQRLDAPTAARFAAVALANVAREYPYQPAHVQLEPGDHADPAVLHPAFHGSYDWHSCVHMHWLLARVLRLRPDLAHATAITATFDARLAPAAIAAEAAYFGRAGTQSFERTYGWAWLLALAQEMHESPGDAPRRWRAALRPLVDVIVARYLEFLPRAGHAIRYGMHSNSAFGLAFALDYARAVGDAAFAERLGEKAVAWFGADCDLPLAFEPSGADFLSPALVEAGLMQRVLDPADFATWLGHALPGLAQASNALAPVRVGDRADPQIVHLDGLNLSRAWCLRSVAGALGSGDSRRPALLDGAARHLGAGMAGLASTDYVGAHWLASFALLALTA